MSRGLYELVALGARYAFAALMVLIVLRAWRLTLIDSRRAAALRRLSPQTGLSGELLVLEGEGKARKGQGGSLSLRPRRKTSLRSNITFSVGAIQESPAHGSRTSGRIVIRPYRASAKVGMGVGASLLIPKTCHPERSAAKSKDLGTQKLVRKKATRHGQHHSKILRLSRSG